MKEPLVLPEIPFLCNATIIDEAVIAKQQQQFPQLKRAELINAIVKDLIVKQEVYRQNNIAIENEEIWFTEQKYDGDLLLHFMQHLGQKYQDRQDVNGNDLLEVWLEEKLPYVIFEPLTKCCCTPSRDQDVGDMKDEAEKPATPKKQRSLHRVVTTKERQDKMVLIPEQSFLMGTDYEKAYLADGEGPVREISVSGFYIDKYQVTNADFLEFVTATNYVSEAEYYGSSFVFWSLIHEKDRSDELLKQNSVVGIQWWVGVPGACWKHPYGPHSDIAEIMSLPVVHVSHNDALAYCQWSKKRLATEAEWELAARGGAVQTIFPWGNDLLHNDRHMMNVFQGTFPTKDEAEDGFAGAAPVGSFPANGFGLYDMIGNVWEWCFDLWQSDHSANSSHNPLGAVIHPYNSHVMKGGSYLCHDSWCNRYRSAARTSNTADSSAGNLGFRCVSDLPAS